MLTKKSEIPEVRAIADLITALDTTVAELEGKTEEISPFSHHHLKILILNQFFGFYNFFVNIVIIVALRSGQEFPCGHFQSVHYLPDGWRVRRRVLFPPYRYRHLPYSLNERSYCFSYQARVVHACPPPRGKRIFVAKFGFLDPSFLVLCPDPGVSSGFRVPCQNKRV